MSASREETLNYYQSKGMRSSTGYGSTPCLLVIDFQYGMTDPECPLGTASLDEPIRVTQGLIECARQFNVPVIYARVAYREDLADGGMFLRKVPALSWLKEGTRWVEIDDRVVPALGEYVLTKRHSSAFIGTEFQQILQTMGVDTVISVGCSTSGCVRQTAVDANAYGFRSIVVSDAVGDRSLVQHEANLVDLEGKYADVVSSYGVKSYFQTLSSSGKSEGARHEGDTI